MVGDVMCIIVACLLCLWLMFNVLAFISSYIWCSRQSRRKPKSIESMLDTKENPHCQFVNVKILAAEYFEGITRYTLGKVARIPSFKLRNLLYRGVFRMNITKRTVIYSGCEFRSPYHIKIGDSVIGPSNIIDGRCGVVIGNHVCTGSGVKIWTLQHDPQSKFFSEWCNSRNWYYHGLLPCNCFTRAKDSRRSSDLWGRLLPRIVSPIQFMPEYLQRKDRECDLSYELRRHWWFVMNNTEQTKL